MLDTALTFLKTELTNYLAARVGPTPAEVKLTQVVNATGGYAFTEDKIGLNLINVEEERIMKDQLRHYTYVDGQHIVQEPELRLNLHIIFALQFQQYDEALKYLSWIILFFQSHPVFTRDRYPALDSRIEKLVPELLTVSYEQMNQIWASMGGKQLPCALYRVRLVAMQDLEPNAIQPPITTIATTLEHQ